MTTAERISIVLPPEMVAIVRSAVATGEYASISEVIRDALRDWTHKRSARQQAITDLRQLWQVALSAFATPESKVRNRQRVTGFMGASR